MAIALRYTLLEQETLNLQHYYLSSTVSLTKYKCKDFPYRNSGYMSNSVERYQRNKTQPHHPLINPSFAPHFSLITPSLRSFQPHSMTQGLAYHELTIPHHVRGKVPEINEHLPVGGLHFPVRFGKQL